MTSQDDSFEARLRRLAAAQDPPPADVLAAAKAAWEVRDLDAELAALVADSWTDEEALATRGPADTVRMLTFDLDGTTVDIDVQRDPAGATARLRGWAAGAAGDVTLVRAGGREQIPARDGHFDVSGLPTGQVRLEFVTSDGRRVTTTWFSV
jgi:hypothetical protein